jgi:hypothetical protein
MMRERGQANTNILAQLRQETDRFAQLCQSYARQVTSRSRRKELRKLRRGMTRNRALLKTLALQAEACEGAYQSVVAACRAIALAELQVKGGR